MDTFTFLVAIVVMMLAVQYDMGWLIFGIAIILILSMRSFAATVLLIVSVATIYLLQGDIKEFAPYIMLGLLFVSLLFENKKKPEQDMYGSDLGALAGLGGGMEGGY